MGVQATHRLQSSLSLHKKGEAVVPLTTAAWVGAKLLKATVRHLIGLVLACVRIFFDRLRDRR